MQNLEKDWVRADQLQTATYTYLPPGKYTFLVKCENEDGVSCAEVTKFSLIIRPPFWQTWWFRAAVIFSILLLGYALYRYRINSILKLQSVRNDISRDLHDDIGATLSSIRVLSEVAKSNLEKGRQDKSYPLLSKISDQSHDMVERMSDIVWTISPRKENLENLRQRLNDFAALACLSRDIQLQFNADNEPGRLSLPMLLRKNMYLIGKEAINNALKHSGCTRIAVTVQNRQDNLILIVADNGSGFDASMVKRANGIDNMEARAKEIKGRLIFHSAGEGTELRLEVAIPRSRHRGFQYFV
jgi:signal transduction histidine kinase